MPQNVRRPVTVSEPYDPKQRAVGGVVLALIMLLIYFFLQTLVVLSAPAGTVQSATGGYMLSEVQPDEVTEDVVEDANGDVYIPLPKSMSQFVFLDIDGTPFGSTDREKTQESLPIIGTHWIVQAASFRKHSDAESLVIKMKTDDIDMEVKKIGSWYTVRTIALRTEEEAKEMEKHLLRQYKIKGLIKKIE